MSANTAPFEMFNGPVEILDPGDAATIPVDRSPMIVPLVSAAAETRTLGRPDKSGAIVTLYMRTDGGDITLTVTGGYNESGTTVFTFTDAGQFLTLQAMYDGTNYFWRTLASSSGGTDAVNLVDDALLSFGTGQDVRMSWDTTDANANELLIQMPAGTAVNVPVIVIGQAIESVDLGMYNGVVDPRVCMLGVGAVTTGPGLDFRKARGTATAPTVVTSGDDVGTIRGYACVAAGEYVQTAEIRLDCAGTVATTRGPGTITFLTATDAAPSVLTAALTISAAQLVTAAAGVTVTTGDVTITAGNAVLGEATLPAGTICYIGRDNTGDTNINALTGKTINLQVNGADIVTLSATVLTFTGTIAATGARVTQSYHTNITSTNAVTVDSSEMVKESIEAYRGDALAVMDKMRTVTYRHKRELDPSGEMKLGIIAESCDEPLALNMIDNNYPGLNLYGLATLQARAIQQLLKRVEKLESKQA